MLDFTAVIGILMVVILFYLYGIRTYNYWEKLGVPYLKPKYPFLGNLFKYTLGFVPKPNIQEEIYTKFKHEKFVGIFNFTIPQLYIIDPTLIEQILIKDFQIFTNHRKQPNKNLNALSMHLLNLENTKWKKLRHKLAPTFSKNKLKAMLEQIHLCNNTLINIIENRLRTNSSTIEMKELMSSLVIDTIGACAFGLEIDAIINTSVQLKEIVNKITNASTKHILIRTVRDLYPNLIKIFNLKQHNYEIENYFKNLVKSTLDYREKNNIKRDDYFQSLIDLRKQYLEDKKNGLKNDPDDLNFDEIMLTSSVFIFIVAGFETTSSILTFLFFELARNQDIQEKLYEHIKIVLEQYNGEITYESVNDMPYLSQVVNETLRLYSIPETIRINSENYQIPGTDIILPKGTNVVIPIHSIQRDEKYFHEPEKFQPERFSKENMKNIMKGTFIPFGDGPRICIGAPFARLSIFTAVVKLLLKYKFFLNPKTKVPINYKCSPVFKAPEDGIWLNVKRREI